MTTHWPTADIDAIQRLRIMAAAVSGAHVSERIVNASIERVWAALGDLDGAFTRIQPDMRHARLVDRLGDRVVIQARSRYGPRARLHGVIRPGWCWLQSRFLIIGMAAAAEPDGRTRVGLTGGVRVPGRAAIVPIRVRREAQLALDRLETLLSA